MKIIKNAFILKDGKTQISDILFDEEIIKIAKYIKVEPDIEVIELH